MTDVKLLVNDKDIPMNEFIKDILININKGFVSSLKEIPDDITNINIEIEL